MHCAKCFFYETDVGDDTCNRCGRAYLPEANVYLGLMLMVTGGLAWTLRHLLTGHMGPFVRPQIDLGAWATWPVSLVDFPTYGLVMGGWLAMLAVAPVLTGAMYGKRGGWLLVGVVALLGPSVVMTAAIGLGVWISAGYTLRLSSKLASTLLGLVPAAVYWFAATALTDFSKGEVVAVPGLADAGSVAEAGRTLAPALQGLAYVPPVAAVCFAAAAAALVVAVGHADRWHVRWPGVLLAILTAGPVLALLAFVGIDEIRYGMTLAGGPPVGPWAAPGKSETDRLQEFLARHPASPRADEVRARLARVLERNESHTPPNGGRLPSQEVWEEIIKRHPENPWAADARLHLGDAAARLGLFDAAAKHYREALAQMAGREPPAEDPLADFTAAWDLFSIGRELRTREESEHLDTVHHDVLARLAILADNRTNKQENSRALGLYFVALGLKGTNAYHDALLAVQSADPKGALADNVAYDLATFEADDTKRIEALAAVAAAWPGTDGAMLAHLKAAQGLIAHAASNPGALREAQQHLLEVQKDLAARQSRDPDDPYVVALGDRVRKELVYVQAQLRTPEVQG
ncbi:MAG: tetratricopeptide repeat protein [Planctomycetes bacterium]|nr:tetratricopeptide repeat protein [Planctomycetota bacterium]